MKISSTSFLITLVATTTTIGTPVSSFVINNKGMTTTNFSGSRTSDATSTSTIQRRFMSTTQSAETTICPLLDPPSNPSGTFEAAMA